jgi:hypothetical protein
LSLNPKVRDHWQVYNCPVNPKADIICTRSISTHLDAEDFTQRTIILCNHIFSIGKVLQAVSPQGGVPFKLYTIRLKSRAIRPLSYPQLIASRCEVMLMKAGGFSRRPSGETNDCVVSHLLKLPKFVVLPRRQSSGQSGASEALF